MGMSKKEFQNTAEELGRIRDKNDQRIILDFLLGMLPQFNANFNGTYFREEVQRQYYVNYGD